MGGIFWDSKKLISWGFFREILRKIGRVQSQFSSILRKGLFTICFMITTIQDFIATVKLMREAQKVCKQTGGFWAKTYASKLENEVDEALNRALDDKKKAKKTLTQAEIYEEVYRRR